MFQMTQRATENTEFEVVGKYLSPVSDAYGKTSLVPAFHRIAMCTLAAEDECKSRIMIDPWETLRHDEEGEPIYTRTADVLRHFDYEINDVLGGVRASDGTALRVRIVLLIGADVAMTMGDPKVWAPSDLDVLLGYYGAFIVERPTQTDIHKAIEPLKKYHKNIWVVESYYNDVSSSKIRAQLQNGESVLDDLPRTVHEYIKVHQLYQAKATNGQVHKLSTGVDT
jgi:nicotinamide mononucleotide adenylyltransferase